MSNVYLGPSYPLEPAPKTLVLSARESLSVKKNLTKYSVKLGVEVLFNFNFKIASFLLMNLLKFFELFYKFFQQDLDYLLLHLVV